MQDESPQETPAVAVVSEYAPCIECGSKHVAVIVDDADLGERGPFSILCEDCSSEFFIPAEATARSRIAKLREIVRDHQAARIDGYIVDAMTANLLCKVYDALSPANREKFGKPNLKRLVDFAWSVAK